MIAIEPSPACVSLGFRPILTRHRITTSRTPTPERLAELLSLYQNVKTKECALTILASVLLNLDDALVK